MGNETVDLPALRAYRLRRVREELRARDYAGIVLFDSINVRYATDSTNMMVWTLHNPVRCAFVASDGPVVLFEFSHCDHLSAGLGTVDEVRPAVSWFYFVTGPRVDEKAKLWAAEIADLVRRHGGGNRRLAVDRLDPAGAHALAGEGITVHDGLEVMERAKEIKSSDEIDAMRASIAACQAGMDAMREALRPGITEQELWSHLHQKNIALGGEWIETRLLSSGPRTNPWYQECADRVIEAGDIVSFDTDLIGPYGYCADISRSWVCGDGRPSDDQRRLYALAHAQIQRCIELVKPGAAYRELADAIGTLPDEYQPNRYTCVAHGVGLCDEYPTIYWKEDFAAHGWDDHLKADMTICVEAYFGAVGGHEGVKLEQQVLITEDGVEDLSTYPFEEDWL
jgi:Xaa-Pro aminopeptidase